MGASTREREPGTRGPARSDATTARIRQATFDLLAEGPGAVTMRAVATRAEVTLPSIYRRWESRDALVADVLAGLLDVESPLPDTGSLRGDLTAHLRSVLALLATQGGAVLRSAVALAVDDPAVEAAILAIHHPRRRESVAMLRRAVARGEVRDDVDLELLADLLVGPLWTRLLVTRAPLAPELAQSVVDLVVRAAAPLAGGRA